MHNASGFFFQERKTMPIFAKNDTFKTALHYIEMYANPIRMAMADLESGEMKDVNVVSLISQLMVDEASHKLDSEVSY
jgi:hypothetical protein